MKESIKGLGESLKPQPEIPKELDKDEFNKNFLDDPYTHMEKLYMAKMGKQEQKEVQRNLHYSRQAALQDEFFKSIHERYKDEVNQVISGLSNSQKLHPEIYKEAIELVGGRHLREIYSEAGKKSAEIRDKGYSEKSTIPSKKKNKLMFYNSL